MIKILVDCRCLNYPFLTGVNTYTIRLLHCLSTIKSQNSKFEITALGLKDSRINELAGDFPFLDSLFETHISLAQYLGHKDCKSTKFNWISNWIGKYLELSLIIQNWLGASLDFPSIVKYDYIILPQPRLLHFHPESKVITIFHDIFAILDKQKNFPKSLIFNYYTSQSLVSRSHKVITGSISTSQDINKTFFGQHNFDNPKIQLIYPALPSLLELQTNLQNSSKLNMPNNLKSQVKSQVKTERIIQPYVLAISGIEPRKNWINLILAHNYLQMNYDWKSTLVLSGSIVDPKYYKLLLNLIAVKQIQNVVWQISPDENQKSELLKSCEFVVYPSYYEGFGFPILEAFEHNKIVVTSKISSMPEIGKDACVYANPFSYQSIANCVYLLHIDPKFKLELESNIAKVKSQYDWSQMTNNLKKLLK